MSSSYVSVNQLINDNNATDFMSASSTLITFATNIFSNPNDSKFRRIRLGNPTVQSKLLNISGGMECLFEMGFQEDGEYLFLHPDTDLKDLRSIKEDLLAQRKKMTTTQSPNPSQSPAIVTSQNLPPSTPVTHPRIPSQSQRSIASYVESEATFLGRIRDGMRRVMLYESAAVQEKARSIIPVHDLKSKAKENFDDGSSSLESTTSLDLQDHLLLALLRWFKLSFFSWVDCLPCSYCNGSTRNTGSVPPSQDDLRWGASRIEQHTCNSCSRATRFPRYTNAEKLLETRKGRCGEWADCFTLCCRALGFEARFVMDWTDHVWTEVFSVSQDRWLHCDPCENICDKPLLYESGWGKKLTYVIAVAKDDVQDVSWRYSAKHAELLSRRNLVREKWLWKTVDQLWQGKMRAVSESRKKVMKERLVKELISFLSFPQRQSHNPSENLPGRTTGSLEWRQARGEIGSASAKVSGSDTGFTFMPTQQERESEMMHICYNCAADKYIRKSSNNEVKRGWSSWVNASKDVFRKEEFDWKMAYLARTEGSPQAEVTWKFDLNGTDLRISKMELKALSAVYESASVNWRICAGEECFVQNGIQINDFMTFDLRGATNLTLTAVMKGGKGDHSWQHSQLFRQSLTDEGSFPLEIKLYLD